jgi:hypothetical protein
MNISRQIRNPAGSCKVLICSFPHSGSHTVQHLLSQLGIEAEIEHFDAFGLRSILHHDGIVVIPKRHPRLIVESLIKRGYTRENALQYIFDIWPNLLIVKERFPYVEVKVDGEPLDYTPLNSVSGIVDAGDISKLSQLMSHWNYGN